MNLGTDGRTIWLCGGVIAKLVHPGSKYEPLGFILRLATKVRRSEQVLFDHIVGDREQRRGAVMPSALAVLKLIASTNLVGDRNSSTRPK